jgi:DNA-binding CsgD family transcriptional regulator
MSERRAGGAGDSQPLTPERLSDIVGAIYDCAIRPELWPQTLSAIGEVTNCFAGMISVIDLEGGPAQHLYTTGYQPGCVPWMSGNGPDIAKLYRSIPDLTAYYDEPASARRTLPAEVFDSSPYVREIGKRYDIIDSITLVLIAGPSRVAEFGLSRHRDQGFVTDQDLATLRLLAPHIRRAITISDLLDMKSIEMQALGSALDSFAVGVVIVGDEGHILHSNEPARLMLAKGAPIVSSGGRLATLQPKTTSELQQAIAVAQANEAEIGKLGIGVPLLDHATRAATAHVLPLARGERRGRLMAQATAAVFVLPIDAPEPVDLQLVARMFSLTPAEGRLLSLLAAGADMAEAAAKLGISAATAKTHRTHLFAKMGVKRRADLLVMLARLIPPVHRNAR